MELGANSKGLQIFNPKSGTPLLLNMAHKVFVPSLLFVIFRLVTNLPLVNPIKAASFHGYLQACSKVPFLGDPRFKQITKYGP